MEKSVSPIIQKLKNISPNIAFSVEYGVDEGYRWDGDGPDPSKEGYVAYNVDVIARAIHNGELIWGESGMGGSYDKPGKKDPDIHGYLPQMLEEAAQDLKIQVSGDLREQAQAAIKYLDEVMKKR